MTIAGQTGRIRQDRPVFYNQTGKNMKLRPMIVAVEGIDGAGKSTQIPHISAWFERHGFRTCETYEPTRGPIGLQIRTSPVRLTPVRERELFVQDRKQHLDECMKPAMQRGEIVITDRYFYSSMAYQGTRDDAFDHAPTDDDLAGLQAAIHDEHRQFAPEADVLIYFRLDVDKALERMRCGRESLDPFENRRNLERVAAAFERVVKGHECVIEIDATRAPEDVTRQINDKLDALFVDG